MSLIITKPVMWNREGYRRPSGVKVNTGFPREHGFGHEEWNGSDALTFREGGANYRIFHTEGVGNAPVDEAAGRTVVFMYASHHGVQELVGIAGSATCLAEDPSQRSTLAQRLRLDRLGKEAWSVPLVQQLHEFNREAFNEVWQRNLAWIPTWRCPADSFLWLSEPSPINAQKVRGTSKLLTMFGRHTEIGVAEALRMMDVVPEGSRSKSWHRIRSHIESSGEDSGARDLSAIRRRADLSKTMKQRLVDARLGQGRFRRDVETFWGEACAVSGCTVRQALRASHILPWKHGTDKQRLDGENGLLLTAELDALFDNGLISFCDDASMIIADGIGRADRALLQVPRPLRRKPSPGQRTYLADHRRRWGFEA
ncbi:HNH endonuclease [Alteriqipengyuania lutimaris]|nr:HNH endonuclease [Alteriqipengyuania lutimaris]MBB3034686.1 putative restriction endonuclease [Alteriqipengyuania lutimaris]